jgi:hypothetical protein
MKRSFVTFTIFLTICFISSSCQIIKRIRAPKKIEKEIVEKTYQKDGVGFSYPDDWFVNEDEISEKNVRTVVIMDYYTSHFRIRVFPLETDINLRKYVENTDQNFRENMPVIAVSEGKISEVTREIQGKPYDGLRLQRITSFNGTNVPQTTDFFLAQNRKYKVVFSIEAVNDEWKVADKEFQLILDSLKFE